MRKLRDRYRVHGIETSTVRDYVAYAARYPRLIGKKGDVKDVQRPWALEAVRARVPRGTKIIDMGGSNCELAAELMDEYEVTIVDPYDGTGGGPRSSAGLQKRYPKITFVHGLLDSKLGLPCQYGCVLSTSVIEHIPPNLVYDALVGIDDVLVPGGWSLHAIDFTVKGDGPIKRNTDAILQRLFDGYPIEESLESVRERVLANYETYYLSPQMYLQWKKARTFDEYPWRLVTTLNLVVEKLADA